MRWHSHAHGFGFQADMITRLLDMGATVEGVVPLVRGDVLARGISLETRLGSGLPLVMGDRVQLQQVLLNLILNGCDAMARSDPARRELRVSTAAEDGYVQVCVADRGHGIAPEHADKIFQPFFTTKDHGFGMGLSICRNIVNTHGGRLWAVANDGGGTKFFFTLPADSREAA